MVRTAHCPGLLFAIALVASGASPDSLNAQPALRTRDSAGVRIIETAARSKAPIAFDLGPAILDLGGLKSNPDDEFSPGAIPRTLRFSDGSVVAVDDGRLRFYDAQGNQKKVVGRKGEGPNEFERLGTICLTRGDTLVAGDDGNRRFTIFDKSGTIVRQLPVGRVDLRDHSCLGDGTFLTLDASIVAGDPSLRRLIRRRTDGAIVDTIMIPYRSRGPNYYFSTPQNINVRGNRIYSSDQLHSQMLIYDMQGRLTSIIRTDDPIERLTAAEAAALQPSILGIGSAANSPAAQKPTEWPGFRLSDVDEGGRIWMEDYPRNKTNPITWTAIDPDGRIVGKFSIPAGVARGDPRVLFFTREGVQIRRRDNDGAEHIVTHWLVPHVRGG